MVHVSINADWPSKVPFRGFMKLIFLGEVSLPKIIEEHFACKLKRSNVTFERQKIDENLICQPYKIGKASNVDVISGLARPSSGRSRYSTIFWKRRNPYNVKTVEVWWEMSMKHE
jgi:hypothetical protein